MPGARMLGLATVCAIAKGGMKADQEGSGSQPGNHGGEVGCQHARRKRRAGESRSHRGPQLGKDELKVLLDQIDRLTDTAAQMLADEKDLN
ncbi:hypothetical protein V1279_003648 [Bradyrhizobium sp. AZCC 1610]|uniref:hypothetical protein n=1 Tax=Bradyrhizobium sp. AZCC 1610 TaxID=3117020 RepID=UPI002FF3ED6A